MAGRIESAQLVTIEPLGSHQLPVGDIVLCKVRGMEYLHLVKAISGNRIHIGNNKGRINGRTSHQNIFGVLTKIED